MREYAVGSLVRARGREWVVLPHSDDDTLMVRPIGGGDDETTGLYLPLEERDIQPARFAPPDPRTLGDARSAGLLRDALVLGLRSSAGPFRSFGNIAVEPRPYQLVPLLMALRLDPVRLLIADDVGIGKTIEAALVARELLDAGDAERLAVLCPPHLAEQWQSELETKFHLSAQLVLASTASRLERGLRVGESLFERHPFVVVSTDFIKSDRRRHEFLRTCPELVIVDEAHTCVTSGGGRSRQQRHELLRGLATDPRRHMLLVTATPHSGNEDAFRSLLALLDEDLARLPADLSGREHESDRRRVARYLVQRRRADIREYADSETPFPTRMELEDDYALSPEYRRLFDRVLDYARESVTDDEGGRRRQRVRWWSALALLRSIGSSPAAAAATLRNRSAALSAEGEEEADELGRRAVMDVSEDEDGDLLDAVPGADAEIADDEAARHRRRLLEMARAADALRGAKDAKLAKATKLVKGLLDDGFSPIIFCRFIPTAEYVADSLRKALKGVEVAAVTGLLPPAEREDRVGELAEHPRRVLVATDCLSEGINMQEHFDAVLHYDLSWNPTRHEQREGRVDRYGQPRAEVRTVTLFGRDNPIDGIVLDVLLRKHKRIRTALGVSIPVPADSDMVMEAILEGLVARGSGRDPEQMSLFDSQDLAPRRERLHGEWDDATAREKQSRTLFAQAGIRVDEVAQEAAEMRAAIGSRVELDRFVRVAVPALHGTARPTQRALELDLREGPRDLRDRLPAERLLVRTDLPVEANETLLVRTHPFVEALSRYIVDAALEDGNAAPAARCGVITTSAVSLQTTLLLVRFRFHIQTARRGAPHRSLAEECRIVAFRRMPARAEWLSDEKADSLITLAPTRNTDPGQGRLALTRVIDGLAELGSELERIARARAHELRASHRRVRHGAPGQSTEVTPELPADVLGVYVYRPEAD